MGHAFGFLSGLVFGIGLILAGMADPMKVKGFLDLAGAWDPSLALVMGGALVPLHHLKISAISLLQFQRIWFATKSSQTAATVSFAMRRMTDRKSVV